MQAIGKKHWAIAEGYIPPASSSADRALISHEAACVLNANERDAQIEITILFADREPAGPYRVTVLARRTLHLRFNDLIDPEPIPAGIDYSSVFDSDVPERISSSSSSNSIWKPIPRSRGLPSAVRKCFPNIWEWQGRSTRSFKLGRS